MSTFRRTSLTPPGSARQPRLRSLNKGESAAVSKPRLAPESPPRHSDRRRRRTAEFGRSLTIKLQKSHQVATKRDRCRLGHPNLGSQGETGRCAKPLMDNSLARLYCRFCQIPTRAKQLSSSIALARFKASNLQVFNNKVLESA